MWTKILCSLVILSLYASPAISFAELPNGCIIPPATLSPDGKYGITAFDSTSNPIPEDDHLTFPNEIIELSSGRSIGRIAGEEAWVRANYEVILPARWSADSSFLLWEVDSKWTLGSLKLLKIRHGKIEWAAEKWSSVRQSQTLQLRVA
jgi:hypothetical protein